MTICIVCRVGLCLGVELERAAASSGCVESSADGGLPGPAGISTIAELLQGASENESHWQVASQRREIKSLRALFRLADQYSSSFKEKI